MPVHPPMVPRREGHTLRAPLLVPEVASFEDEDPLDVEAGDPRVDKPPADAWDGNWLRRGGPGGRVRYGGTVRARQGDGVLDGP